MMHAKNVSISVINLSNKKENCKGAIRKLCNDTLDMIDSNWDWSKNKCYVMQ